MSKLSFRARALDASKPMPIYMAEELPDLPDYSAINRAVPQMPSGMEKEEECVSWASFEAPPSWLAIAIRCAPAETHFSTAFRPFRSLLALPPPRFPPISAVCGLWRAWLELSSPIWEPAGSGALWGSVGPAGPERHRGALFRARRPIFARLGTIGARGTGEGGGMRGFGGLVGATRGEDPTFATLGLRVGAGFRSLQKNTVFR